MSQVGRRFVDFRDEYEIPHTSTVLPVVIQLFRSGVFADILASTKNGQYFFLFYHNKGLYYPIDIIKNIFRVFFVGRLVTAVP